MFEVKCSTPNSEVDDSTWTLTSDSGIDWATHWIEPRATVAEKYICGMRASYANTWVHGIELKFCYFHPCDDSLSLLTNIPDFDIAADISSYTISGEAALFDGLISTYINNDDSTTFCPTFEIKLLEDCSTEYTGSDVSITASGTEVDSNSDVPFIEFRVAASADYDLNLCIEFTRYSGVFTTNTFNAKFSCTFSLPADFEPDQDALADPDPANWGKFTFSTFAFA